MDPTIRSNYKEETSLSNFVIAITRTCGSGGTTVAKILCKHFGINMYDKNLLRLASDDSGINEELFHRADETTKKSLLYSISRNVYSGELIPPESNDYTANDNLFNFQAKVLRELARQESYVCIGRAADFILRDYPNLVRVFIHAPHENCVAHEMQRSGVSRKEAEERIRTTDKYRQEYYAYHTGRKWLDVRNYDLCINTMSENFERAAKVIEDYMASTIL